MVSSRSRQQAISDDECSIMSNLRPPKHFPTTSMDRLLSAAGNARFNVTNPNMSGALDPLPLFPSTPSPLPETFDELIHQFPDPPISIRVIITSEPLPTEHLRLTMDLISTVGELRARIANEHQQRAAPDRQQLQYNNAILQDDSASSYDLFLVPGGDPGFGIRAFFLDITGPSTAAGRNTVYTRSNQAIP